MLPHTKSNSSPPIHLNAYPSSASPSQSDPAIATFASKHQEHGQSSPNTSSPFPSFQMTPVVIPSSSPQPHALSPIDHKTHPKDVTSRTLSAFIKPPLEDLDCEDTVPSIQSDGIPLLRPVLPSATDLPNVWETAVSRPRLTSIMSKKRRNSRPRGRPPKDMVWNETLGHYTTLDGRIDEKFEMEREMKKQKRNQHDLIKLGYPSSAMHFPRPEGPSPRGMKWDRETGRYVRSSAYIPKYSQSVNGDFPGLLKNKDGTYKRPRGRTPKGKLWNAIAGEWENEHVPVSTKPILPPTPLPPIPSDFRQ